MITDKSKAAVCGLFCPACTLYLGTHEEPARLERLAAQFKQPVAEVQCDGCRSDRRNWYCRDCKLSACAATKGIDFCGECNEYPCQDLKEFQASRPHRLELWEAQARIKEAGFEVWYQEAAKHYACPDCGTINSAYDLACRKCGRKPGNAYVAKHGEKIEAALRALQEKK